MGFKVLVIGESIQSFLSIVRSLGRKGLEVQTASNSTRLPSLRSRFIRKRHLLPPYSCDSDMWTTTLLKLFEREQFDLVIPCHDSSIVPLQKHKKELAAHGRICLLNTDCFEIISSKAATYNLALESGVNVPRQVLTTRLNCPELSEQNFHFPLVLKPVASVTMNNLFNRYEVKTVHDRQQMNLSLSLLLNQGPVLIQECFEGTGTGIEFLAFEGKLLYAFQHIRIHERIGGGPSCYRKSCRVMPTLLNATCKLIENLNYTGVGMAEYKINLKTNEWVFLEINGRFWGSLPLAVASGADFPYYLFQMMVQDRRDFSSETYQENIFCRNLLLDAAWFYESVKTKNFGHSFNRLSFKSLLKEIKTVLKGNERIDSITRDDVIPGILQIKETLSSLVKGDAIKIPWT